MSKSIRPFVLAVYKQGQKELPEGGRNPWEAEDYVLALGEPKAEALASVLRKTGFPVDVLQVRMSGFP